MIKILLISLGAIILLIAGAIVFAKYSLSNPNDNKNLEAYLDKEVQKVLDKKLSYGIVVGVYKEGQTFIKSYGVQTKLGDELPTSKSIFQIGSLTKLFTTSLLQILSDEGRIDIDATLEQTIGNQVKISPKISQITLRQLANHTSGLPPLPKAVFERVDSLINPYANLSINDLLEFLAEPKDIKKPGKFKYSNLGMGLLGHVLEWVTGENLEELYKTKVFLPLNMNNSGITITPEMNQNLVTGYTKSGDVNPPWEFSIWAGAGAINSNADDMMKFVKANIKADNQLSLSLQKAHIAQPNAKAGLGWMQPALIEKFFSNSDIVWHNGQVGGYTSYLSVDKVNQSGVVILSNKSVDITMLGILITRAIRTQSWSQ